MRPQKSSGFIKILLIIIAAILILSYFGVSLRKIANSETGKDNLAFLKEIGLKIWHFLIYVWDHYLAKSIKYVWNDIFLKYVWNSIVENIDKINK